ncbi:vesicle transport protein SEC20-like [Saccostrea echinata]|uniref:vesicle transport protein SEC20-like n=1 Tax=Saccostrea echinata TaxID=191078 RepID=UPI002A8309E9|nr:vesicle transport protein SEC20-like [Saccostrea echinata]
MAAEDSEVRSCLQEIVKLDLEIKALIQDIRECALTEDILEDLNKDARLKIGKLQKKIEDLEVFGIEADLEEDRQVIMRDVENHKDRLSNIITSLRQSNLTAKFAMEKANTEKLMTSRGSGARQRGRNKESLVKQANAITESLYGINKKLTEQLSQSEATKGTLIKSSNTVTDTMEEFKNMGAHIGTSQKLLSKYNRRQLTDKFLIFLALVFFIATVLYIIKKRLW